MAIQPPLITYYARVIDNVTGEEIFKSTEASKNMWYYGNCNGLEGGESQYIVEFDVWNNEPAYNAGTYDSHCLDAIHCKFSVWPDVNLSMQNSNPIFALTQPFMYARCISNGYDVPFSPLRYNNSIDIFGNNDSSLIGVLQGNGDHSIIQTKIILPPNSNLDILKYNFILNFSYDFV